MARPARVSPDRILAAAAAEFAARGFAGARVDRIARRARVNKAMLYYHFKSKNGLYRTLLRRVFASGAERLQAIAAADEPAGVKMHRAVAAISEFLREHAYFPPVMLREVAEGGTHLDRETLTAMSALPRAIADIVQQGNTAGEFAAVHPLHAYFTMIAPLIFFYASAPIRAELLQRHLLPNADAHADVFVAHMQTTIHRMLARLPAPAGRALGPTP